MKTRLITALIMLTLAFASCEAPEFESPATLQAQPVAKTPVPAELIGNYFPHAGETVTGSITMHEYVINMTLNGQDYTLFTNELVTVVNSNYKGICNITITLLDGSVIKFVNFLECCNRITVYINGDVVGVFDKQNQK